MVSQAAVVPQAAIVPIGGPEDTEACWGSDAGSKVLLDAPSTGAEASGGDPSDALASLTLKAKSKENDKASCYMVINERGFDILYYLMIPLQCNIYMHSLNSVSLHAAALLLYEQLRFSLHHVSFSINCYDILQLGNDITDMVINGPEIITMVG